MYEAKMGLESTHTIIWCLSLKAFKSAQRLCVGTVCIKGHEAFNTCHYNWICKRNLCMTNKKNFYPHHPPLLFSVCRLLKPLTHRAEHDQGVHRAAAGPGHDFGWLESHLHRLQSNSATVDRDVVCLLFVLLGKGTFTVKFLWQSCW